MNYCPSCSNAQLGVMKNSLGVLHPELIEEWDEEKNSFSIFEISYGSKKKVFWKCKKGHRWTASICNRTRGQQCPYCKGKLPIYGETDLETVFPLVAKEWHPTMNHDKLPRDYLPTSNKNVWWMCKYGHVWRTKIAYRTIDGCNCPECYKKGS